MNISRLFSGVADRNSLNQQSTGRKTIFAGELGLGQAKGTQQFDRVSQIREQARKKASKILGDVFDSEKKLEQQITEMKEKSGELVSLRRESMEELKKAAQNQTSLMEYYGVEEGSEEYRELELLRRERDAVPHTDSALTYEEEKEIARIHERGVTDFCKDMLELDDTIAYHEGQLQSAESGISGINESLRQMQIERLKSDPMRKAMDQAEEVMQSASKEILGEFRKEGMEHIEEKIEEVVEKAKEEAEKKEEQEEKLKERKEKKEEMEEQIQAVKEHVSEKEESIPEPDLDLDLITSYNATKNKADKELERLIENLEMIMDDLKGAEIDVNL